ncbi:MAG: hypothetical protein RLZ98_1581 [Pseudomonadota bacterium]
MSLRSGINGAACRSTGTAGIIALIFALAGSGCQSANTPQIQGIGKGEACVNDSQQCISERSSALNALLLDKNNRWLDRSPSVDSYASGVRLFALKSRKRSLSCNDLTRGVREADAAPAVLRGPGAGRLTPAQVSRGLMFATEVSRELKREARRKGCRV